MQGCSDLLGDRLRVQALDLELLVRLGRSRDSPHAEMPDVLDCSSSMPADSLVSTTCFVVLLDNNYIAAALFDVFAHTLRVEGLQTEQVYNSDPNI